MISVDIREDLFFSKESHLDVVRIRLGLRHAARRSSASA